MSRCVDPVATKLSGGWSVKSDAGVTHAKAAKVFLDGSCRCICVEVLCRAVLERSPCSLLWLEEHRRQSHVIKIRDRWPDTLATHPPPVVGILGPGQFFGEGCMNGHSLRIATTTAMEECLITVITKTAMLAALHDQPKFSELFMAYLLTRNSRIEEDLIDQLFNSSEKRLARLLLLLANFGKEGSPQLITPNISQETLAEMIGTTRSRVSFFMNRFRKLGFISYNRKIEVNSSLLNAVLYDKPEIKSDDQQ